MTDLNRMLGGGHPDLAGLHDALFHQPQDEAKLMRYYNLMQPESLRAIWDMTSSICFARFAAPCADADHRCRA